MSSEIVSVEPNTLTLKEELGGEIVGAVWGAECLDCGALEVGKRVQCPSCSSDAVRNEPLLPVGTLKNYTVVHRPTRTWIGPSPYVLAVGTLAGGRELVCEWIASHGAEAPALHQNVRLQLVVVNVGERRIALYKWCPMAGSDDLADDGADVLPVRN